MVERGFNRSTNMKNRHGSNPGNTLGFEGSGIDRRYSLFGVVCSNLLRQNESTHVSRYQSISGFFEKAWQLKLSRKLSQLAI